MLLQLRNVAKAYCTRAGRREVLHNINFDVAEGEFVCVVGYSGSGKTTLMNLASGLLQADTGVISFAGKPVSGPSLDRALIFQNYSLLPWLSTLRNVELAVAACLPRASGREITDRAKHYLSMVKLTHALDRRPAELSGGMRQRVSLARGLAMEPKLLLLDEPLGALDALTRAELQDEFMRIQHRERRTMLMITNDVDEAIMLADRIIPMSSGPRATLGEAVEVKLSRPYDRTRLNFDPAFQSVRRAVLSYLLANGPAGPARRNSSPAAPASMSASCQASAESRFVNVEETA